VPFKLYLINEFQRLKEEEQKQIGWSAKRELAKLNYHIHTDAIKHNLIPKELSAFQTSIIYANEADVMNIAKKINEATTTNPPNAMRLNKTRINHNYGLLIFLPGSFFLRLQFPLRFAD
jgi:phage regulator Rha-like protein